MSEGVLAQLVSPGLVLLAAYLVGSLSPAYWVARAKGVDLRQHGSGNLGATNAGRVLGAWAFAVVFLLDVCKGAGPVVAVFLVGESATWAGTAPVLAGAAAVVGHVFPCWHGWRGGKAVATSLGVLVAVAPASAGGAAAVFFLVWLAQRLFFGLSASAAVGLASTMAALSAPFWRISLQSQPWQAPAAAGTLLIVLLAVLIVWRHRRNLLQLVRPGDKQLHPATSSSTHPGLPGTGGDTQSNA
jgi:glycerol-3-phosphate acyltransferase PlsY